MDSCLFLRSPSSRRAVRSSSSSFFRRCLRLRSRSRCSVTLATAAEVAASAARPFRTDRGLSGSKRLSAGSCEEEGVRNILLFIILHTTLVHVFGGSQGEGEGRNRK